MTSVGHRERVWRTLLVASAFLLVQLVAVAHAASFGDAPHSHDGTPCAIQLLSDHAPRHAVPPCILHEPITTQTNRHFYRTAPAHPVFSHSRPSRAPPFLSF